MSFLIYSTNIEVVKKIANLYWAPANVPWSLGISFFLSSINDKLRILS